MEGELGEDGKKRTAITAYARQSDPCHNEWNTSLSNRPFEEKRESVHVPNGLRVNSEYFAREIEQWDETAILARADWLTDGYSCVWPMLDLPVLTKSFTKPKSVAIKNNKHIHKTLARCSYRHCGRGGSEMGGQFPCPRRKVPPSVLKGKTANWQVVSPDEEWLVVMRPLESDVYQGLLRQTHSCRRL